MTGASGVVIMHLSSLLLLLLLLLHLIDLVYDGSYPARQAVRKHQWQRWVQFLLAASFVIMRR